MQQVNREKDAQFQDKHTSQSGRIYYGWIVVAACFFIIAPTAPLFSSFSIFQTAILDEMNWSRASFAITFSIYLVFGGLTAPIAGGLLDRFGPRRIMPIGAILTALGLILTSRSSTPWHFYVAYGLLTAAGSSLIQIVPLTALVTKWFSRYRGMAIGIVNTGSAAGQAALLPVIKILIDNVGWRHAYLALGLTVMVIPTTLIWLFLYTRPEDRGLSIEDEAGGRDEAGATTEASEKEPERIKKGRRRTEVVILDKQWAEVEWSVRRASGTVRFWALGLALTFFSVGAVLIALQIPTYLKDKGYNSIIIASVVGLQGIFNMGGDFLGGFLSDRIGREKTLTLSLVIFSTGIVFLNIVGGVSSPTLVYVFTVFYGIGQGMAIPPMMISTSDLFQGKHFGKILGVVFLGGYFGGAIGAWLSGRLFDLTHAYQASFLGSGLAMLISVALIWKARPGSVRQVRRVPKITQNRKKSVEAI